MLTDSLAPIKRAGLFFGFMALAVTGLTLGAGLQTVSDQSSSSVAQAKIERHIPADIQMAAVDPGQKVVGTTKRAMPNLQQASAEPSRMTVLR